jgi:hypothetical protein
MMHNRQGKRPPAVGRCALTDRLGVDMGNRRILVNEETHKILTAIFGDLDMDEPIPYPDCFSEPNSLSLCQSSLENQVGSTKCAVQVATNRQIPCG